MFNRHEALAQTGSRVGNLVHSERLVFILPRGMRGCCCVPHTSEFRYAKTEAVEALLKHVQEKISRKAASIAAPSEDSFNGWSKELGNIISVPDLTRVPKELLREAMSS